MIEKNEFISRIRKLKTFKSKTGRASYSNLKLEGNILSFKRDNTGLYWELNIENAYKAYVKENYLDTVVLQKYVTGRVFSPTLGLLMATGLCDGGGIRKIK
jgi:hypothetical protein